MPRLCQCEDFPSLSSVYPPGKWVWRGDCQHHTDKVTVGHTLLSLPSLCGCCCVLFLFSPSISLPLLLSPLCLHLSPCLLYLVAKAFQAASSSLGILEAQQSPHTYTHILLRNTYTGPTYSRDLGNNRFFFCLWVYFFWSIASGKTAAVLKSCSQ